MTGSRILRICGFYHIFRETQNEKLWETLLLIRCEYVKMYRVRESQKRACTVLANNEWPCYRNKLLETCIQYFKLMIYKEISWKRKITRKFL